MSNEGDTDDENSVTTAGLTGAEHFLVGVSPQYWSHAAMSIRCLHELGLVNGIDCLVVRRTNAGGSSKKAPHDAINGTSTREASGANDSERKRNELDLRFIPVSKCELLGVIVYADCKSNGSCLYILDDGTGLVDCIAWVDNSTYSLPPLVPTNDFRQTDVFRVGDMVQVLGKIKCVSIGRVRDMVKSGGRTSEIRDCVREVQITSIVPLARLGGKQSTSVNAQSNHWLRCLQFQRRALLGTDVAADTRSEQNEANQLQYLTQSNKRSEPILNGAGVLSLLGPRIASAAVQGADIPTSDDAHAAWRLFGAGCRCNLPYKDSLLYCHCIATVVLLDPLLKFRDTLLELLLEMERNVSRPATRAPSMEDCQLHFQYKSVVCNEQLQKAATQIVTDDTKMKVSIDQLFRKTFGALRKDGIVSLLNDKTDTYLLVSRSRVIEPYLAKQMAAKASSSFVEKRILQSEQPVYLRNVPNARLQYVMRALLANHDKIIAAS